MTGTWFAVPALAAGLLLAAPASAQDVEKPSIRIEKPGPDDIPLGETTIAVRLLRHRPGDVVEVYVDGRPAGRLEGEPWSLAWDAGSAPRPHRLEAVLLREGREVAVSRVRTRGLGFAATADARVVSLSPIVTDSSGSYVRGLSREDFSLLVNGRPQEIETFEAANSALSVVLVLDVSGSMALKLREARAAAL